VVHGSYRVIRDGILANCVNISKRMRVFSPLERFFFKDSSKRISLCFFLSFSTGPGQVLTSLVGVLRQMSGRTTASTIYQNVCQLAVMWRVMLLKQASLPLNR